jgi:SAM-dependent methyltransferase
MSAAHAVVWHDVECHGYSADLPFWRSVAGGNPGPILDVGAGTGRVALDLAAAGHEVVALDTDAVLLAALRARAADRGLRVETAVADAQAFALERSFAVVLVPMQTIQLLGDRAGFLAAARAHLRPGGLLAAAIADELVAFEPDPALLPDPDVGEQDGWHFASQPVAVRVLDGVARIERLRSTTSPDGTETTVPETIELARLDAGTLEREAAGHGLRAEPVHRIAATPDHVGSTVVMLRG